jgi:hypothetical protein
MECEHVDFLWQICLYCGKCNDHHPNNECNDFVSAEE